MVYLEDQKGTNRSSLLTFTYNLKYSDTHSEKVPWGFKDNFL